MTRLCHHRRRRHHHPHRQRVRPGRADADRRAGRPPPRRRAQLGHGVPRPVHPLAHGLREPAGGDHQPGRQVTARALNDRGRVLLPVIAAAMRRVGDEQPTLTPDGSEPAPVADNSKRRRAPDEVTVYVPEGEGAFTEEERSRQPTVFSALREIVAAFGCDDPHLGLYGAFGYDLAFQFEPVRLRMDRSDGQRDLVLHLPDEI